MAVPSSNSLHLAGGPHYNEAMKPIRFIMVGGFLGAGKTTTIGRLAGMLTKQGHRVGIVTNDQAADLVDTVGAGWRTEPEAWK